MKRKTLRVRSEGSIPPYVTEAESRKQHSDSPLCNSLKSVQPTLVTLLYVSVKGCTLVAQKGGAILPLSHQTYEAIVLISKSGT